MDHLFVSLPNSNDQLTVRSHGRFFAGGAVAHWRLVWSCAPVLLAAVWLLLGSTAARAEGQRAQGERSTHEVTTASGSAAGARHRGKDGTGWLGAMNSAMGTETYDGVFSYLRDGQLTHLRIVHTVVDGEHHERLVHLDGIQREILRAGDVVSCMLQPEDAMMELADAIPAGPFARSFSRNFEELPEQYQVDVVGLDRIADRAAVVVDLTPRDAYRYGYRLWIDDASGVLLKSLLLDARGMALEIFQFATITIGGTVAQEHLRPTDMPPNTITHELTMRAPSDNGESAAPKAPAEQWHVGWLPPGFMMAARDLRRVGNGLRTVDTLMYSDGLAAFSVFVEPVEDEAPQASPVHQGATVAVSEVVTGPSMAYLVTVVGEVPAGTAQKVATSVYHAANPADH